MVCLAALAAVAPEGAGQAGLERRAIRAAQRVSVARLDPALPRQRFDRWLAALAGPAGAIRWELNDCGEQTGDPGVDRGRDVPLCAEATASLSDGRTAHVSIAVGSRRRGIAGPVALYSAGIEKERHFEFIATLSELTRRVRAVN